MYKRQAKLAELGATRIQLDEPALVKDLTAEEKTLFLNLYNKLLADKKGLEAVSYTHLDVYKRQASIRRFLSIGRARLTTFK